MVSQEKKLKYIGYKYYIKKNHGVSCGDLKAFLITEKSEIENILVSYSER